MMLALAYLFPEIFSYCAQARVIVTDAGIQRWDAALGTQPTPAEIAAAMLPATKAARIDADRQECQRRIFQYWPLQEQITALAGNYEPGGLDSLTNWQAANIAASNASRDTINLPSTDTAAKVEAVTVSWPVWNG